MQRWIVGVAFLLVLPALALGCARRPTTVAVSQATRSYEILSEDARVTELREQTGAYTTTTVYMPPGTSADELRRVAEDVLERQFELHRNVVYVTIYMVDTHFNIPYAYNTAVAYWRLPEFAHATAPVRHGLVLDFYPRQKVTNPDGLPRPTDDEIRYTCIAWRLSFTSDISPEDLEFFLEFEQEHTEEQLSEILNRVHIWLNY